MQALNTNGSPVHGLYGGESGAGASCNSGRGVKRKRVDEDSSQLPDAKKTSTSGGSVPDTDIFQRGIKNVGAYRAWLHDLGSAKSVEYSTDGIFEGSPAADPCLFLPGLDQCALIYNGFSVKATVKPSAGTSVENLQKLNPYRQQECLSYPTSALVRVILDELGPGEKNIFFPMAGAGVLSGLFFNEPMNINKKLQKDQEDWEKEKREKEKQGQRQMRPCPYGRPVGINKVFAYDLLPLGKGVSQGDICKGGKVDSLWEFAKQTYTDEKPLVMILDYPRFLPDPEKCPLNAAVERFCLLPVPNKKTIVYFGLGEYSVPYKPFVENPFKKAMAQYNRNEWRVKRPLEVRTIEKPFPKGFSNEVLQIVEV